MDDSCFEVGVNGSCKRRNGILMLEKEKKKFSRESLDIGIKRMINLYVKNLYRLLFKAR